MSVYVITILLHTRTLYYSKLLFIGGTAVEPTNEELDSEPDEWEAQQVKKAMTVLPDITGINYLCFLGLLLLSSFAF